MLLLLSADPFQNIISGTLSVSKGTLSVSNSSDPDQDRCSVVPDLGPKCLLRLSADDNSCC